MFAPTTTTTPTTYIRAAALLEGDICIWCEAQPKAATSHLCVDCQPQDSGGVFRRTAALRAVATPG